MASNNDDDGNRNQPESNPFIVFRRFADEQASALFDALHGSFNGRRGGYNTAREHPVRDDKNASARPENDHERAKERETPSQNQVDSRLQDAFEGILSGDFDRARLLSRDMQAAVEKELAKKLNGLESGDLERVKRMARAMGGLDAEVERIMKQGADEEQKSMTEKDESGRDRGWWNGGWWAPRGRDATAEDAVAQTSCRWNKRRYDNREKENAQVEQVQQAGSAWSNMKNTMDRDEQDKGNGEPKVYEWSWSWTYPPRSSENPQEPTRGREIDGSSSSRRQDRIDRQSNIFDDFDKAFEDAFGVFKSLRSTSPWSKHDNHAVLHSSEYSPLVLQHDHDLEDSGVNWRDAYEDLVRAERNLPLLPSRELGKASQLPFHHWTGRFLRPEYQTLPQTSYPKRVPWYNREESTEASEGSEPSYEYSHDHEDQHDDPPTPKMNMEEFPPPSLSPSESQDAPLPETELEIYERLLGPFPPAPDSTHPEASPSQEAAATQTISPSILSTLTTTERTVAPDGTLTTKMVLKKRFSDGREESSETVHTQRGQGQIEDGKWAWDKMWDAQFGSGLSGEKEKSDDKCEKGEGQKKSGWFWSG